MADDVARLIDVLQLERPVVVGYSDGAQVALEFGLRHPGVARALVLGGVVSEPHETYLEGLLSWGFPAPGEIDVATVAEEFGAEFFNETRAAHTNIHDDEQWDRFLRQISQLWLTVPRYTEAQLATITEPTLVITGDRDDMAGLDQAGRLFRHLLTAELAVIPTATTASPSNRCSGTQCVRSSSVTVSRAGECRYRLVVQMVPIVTLRLVLQPVTTNLARAVVAGLLQDIPCGAGWPHADTADAMSLALGPNAGPSWLIAVDGVVIGDCGGLSWPDQRGAIEIGYGLAGPYRSRGYATEATAGMCQWLFAEAGATLITATGVDADNVASRRVLEKLGFEQTGDSFRLSRV